MVVRSLSASLLLATALALPAAAQSPAPTAAQTEFFEKEIRPVLAERCYGCHNSKMKTPMGGLVLDTKAGVKAGGNGGPILTAATPGDPKSTRLYKALSYNETDVKMPPTGKLPDPKIDAFAKWIGDGAPDPRADSPAGAAPVSAAKKGMDIESGRKWWSFQPVAQLAQPKVRNTAFAKTWAQQKLDWFILSQLEKNKLKPSPAADKATLIERASLDLTGIRPTYDEIQAFQADTAPGAYDRLVDRLLASPRYGERWGRYWLDVARYGEDNPTSEATNPPYPFAWRYRDWVIEAVNKDVPYDKFVKLQLAADQIPGTQHDDLRALGYVGAAPIYHTDLRLSRDVIETLFTDGWDERVDAVSRGILGLTVGCARCHDHKFDPILLKDYYAMVGVFSSTMAAPRPVAEVDKETEQKFMHAATRLFYLNYLANLMNGEPGSKPDDAAKQVAKFTKEMTELRDSMAFLKDGHPEMYTYLANLVRVPQPPRKPMPPAATPAADAKPADAKPADAPPARPANAVAAARRRQGGASDLPFMQSVYDAGVWIDGSDPDLTMVDIRPGVARDMNLLPHANVASPGAIEKRHFLSVLSKGDGSFTHGSGRLDLAEKLFSDSAPLAARVIVNRVWGWHFGKPLVATQSDFGVQGEKPTHPELLDDLAARFIANGWSLKWLHKEIMLSATYKQSSHPRADGNSVDPTNKYLWRMNPRRLDVEAYRDNLLKISDVLDTKPAPLSLDLDASENHSRTVYGRVSRGRINTVLQLYDFPDANLSSPQRDLTTSPLQQLFVMNSPFMKECAEELAKLTDSQTEKSGKVREMYRRALQRDPSPRELDLALSYLDKATPAEYAQALLATNEVIFWP